MILLAQIAVMTEREVFDWIQKLPDMGVYPTEILYQEVAQKAPFCYKCGAECSLLDYALYNCNDAYGFGERCLCESCYKEVHNNGKMYRSLLQAKTYKAPLPLEEM